MGPDSAIDGPPADALGTVVLSAEQLQTRIDELGREIARDYEDRVPLLVAVLKGAFIFLADLVRAISVPHEIDFMAVSSYGTSTRSSGIVRIVKDLDIDLEGRHVLLVEDIVDSGLTLAYLRRMLSARNPASLEVCALLARETHRAAGAVEPALRGLHHLEGLGGRLRPRRGRTLAQPARAASLERSPLSDSRWPPGPVPAACAEYPGPFVKAQVMGVVNVTPDSFSDGGRWFDHASAIARGMEVLAEGAAIVDVGGESTRPGAAPVDPVEEQRRVLPVVEALADHGRISIDTRHAETAKAAVAAGATVINDVSASLLDVAADLGVGWVAMHMQGDPRTMQDQPIYGDVVNEVRDHLVARAEEAVAAGVDEVWIDPGFGFGKTLTHNLELLGHLDVLVATGFPVAVGLSRKAFLGRLLAASDAGVATPVLPGLAGAGVPDDIPPVPASDRIEGSLSAASWAALQGVALIRAHDVRATVHAVELVGDVTPTGRL